MKRHWIIDSAIISLFSNAIFKDEGRQNRRRKEPIWRDRGLSDEK